MPKILVFAGSARRDSLNKKLARVAADVARAAGGEVTFLDLDDYPMPVYHGDLEAAEGMPENARKVRDLFLAHDALFIASPENNQSISALLKNVIDWLSRDIGDGKAGNSGLAPYRGKVAGIMNATPGPYGGVRHLFHLRQVLSGLGVIVMPHQVQLAHADKAFDAAGQLTDERAAKALGTLARSLVQLAGQLRAGPG
ncbi:MAG TPA: NAD(P)H-dependent oxidoreductase [Usitatibacter sp.]|nr:NAD(P)H-dependent oxidoreductase [Usitatibacter sp.]